MSLSTCYLEYGRHVARLRRRRRRRRRAYAPTSNTASHDNHELMGFLLFPIYWMLMGLRYKLRETVTCIVGARQMDVVFAYLAGEI